MHSSESTFESLLAALPAPPTGKRGWPWTTQELTMQGSNSRHDVGFQTNAGAGTRNNGLTGKRSTPEVWPKITVVTPSYNQGEFLEETIRSVLLQGYPNLEYIVIDGGSMDGSVDIIRKYENWIDYWVSESDRGQSQAINKGFSHATGQWGTWINSDDMLYPRALRTHARRFPFQKGTIYVGECLYVDATADRILKRHTGAIHDLSDLLCVRDVWRNDGHLVQPEILFPVAAFRESDGLNERNHYSMDFELWGRMLESGLSIVYTDISFGIQRVHEQQKTTRRTCMTRSLAKTVQRLCRQSKRLHRNQKRHIRKQARALLPPRGRKLKRRLMRTFVRPVWQQLTRARRYD